MYLFIINGCFFITSLSFVWIFTIPDQVSKKLDYKWQSTLVWAPAFHLLSPQIYFMCSTEICSPLDGPCVEGCFGHWWWEDFSDHSRLMHSNRKHKKSCENLEASLKRAWVGRSWNLLWHHGLTRGESLKCFSFFQMRQGCLTLGWTSS